MVRKNFANLSAAALANMIGVQLEGRKAVIRKDPEQTQRHYLSAQIHLFLVLHFYANSNDGATGLLSISMLADQIHRDPKTVKRSLLLLEQGGFLSVSFDCDEKEADIRLLGLQEMYKRRGEGGKGYITCGSEMLSRLLAASDINSLRVSIFALLSNHVAELSGSAKVQANRIPISTFRECFPASARPCDIRQAASPSGAFGSIFSRTSPDTKKVISVRLQEELNGKYMKSRIRQAAKDRIHAEIDAINGIIQDCNIAIKENHQIPLHNATRFLKHQIDVLDSVSFTAPDHNLPLLDLTSAVINDCAVMAQDLGSDSMIRAIRIYYEQYLLPGNFKPDAKKSIGGLIRSIVAELFHFDHSFDVSLA